MKATDLLRTQHREVEELFRRLDGPVGRRELEEAVTELATVVGAHMLIEQEIFYPACADALDDRDLVRHHYREHEEAAEKMRDLVAMGADRATLLAQAREVRRLILHHVADEETDLLPRAEPALGNKKLELLGAQMEARFDEGVELGYEVTIAEGSVDENDVDRGLAQRPPMGERAVPKKPGARTNKKATSAMRHLAHKKSVAAKLPTKGAGGRRPKGAGPNARKTRQGRQSR